MARLYLDENISRNTQYILAQNGHEVAHAFDLGNRATPDPEHLLVAATEERILVTFNRRDFRVLHQFWTALNTWGSLNRRHAGILTALGDVDEVPWANLVHNFLLERQILDNQMWEWHRQQQDWFRFGW